jgi:hypothetical protein
LADGKMNSQRSGRDEPATKARACNGSLSIKEVHGNIPKPAETIVCIS